jgi:hypothetical protein
VEIATGEPARCGAPLTESKSLYESPNQERKKGAQVGRDATAHSQRPPFATTQQPGPKLPPPKPKPIITKRQACGSYGGTDAFACNDSFVFGCVFGHLKERVQAYYEGNAPDPSTQALRWARRFYGRQGSWEAGMAGCQAALLDEYQRLYRGA